MTGDSLRMMIDLNFNNSWTSWLRTRVLFHEKGERGYSVSGIITMINREWRQFLYIFGYVKILTRVGYFGGPQDHWI